MSKNTLPEFADFASFVEYLIEDDRSSYNHVELTALAENTQTLHQKLVKRLAVEGFELEKRAHEPRARGFKSNDHDRWIASPTHGGSGIDSRSGVNGER